MKSFALRSNHFRFLSWVKEAGREVMRLSRRSSFWSWVRELMQGGSCSMTLSLSKRTLRFVSWQLARGSPQSAKEQRACRDAINRVSTGHLFL